MSETLAKRLLALVEVDSVIGDEGPICDAVEAELRAYDHLVVERVSHSLAARPKTRQHAQLITLAGHLDTVPAPAPNPARVEGDKLYGLGSSDMKSGLAIMLELLARPLLNPAYDLAFIFYDGEEGPYDGSGLGPLLEQAEWIKDETSLAFCLEPSDNVLQLGCLGTINARVDFRGQAAHSARPWQGNNAIHQAGPLLCRLAALAPLEHRFTVGETTELCYREVVSATLASGGVARNIVPAAMELNLNYRYAPGRSPQSAEHWLAELVGEGAELDIFDHGPSGAIPVGNPVLERFCERCPVPVAAKQAWTDVGRFSACGIDAVNFGPGLNSQAHQKGEHTSLALLAEGDRLLRHFLAI